MANGILWQLVGNVDPLGRYAQGLQQHQKQQNILQQLAGQEQDRQFRQQTDARNFERQTQQDTQNQSNWDRQFAQNAQNQNAMRDLQRQQFEFQKQTASTADIRAIKNADGSETLVRINRQTGVPEPINVPGENKQPLNPFAPAGKMTDAQANAALYANRMAESNDILSRYNDINKGVGGWAGGVVSNVAPSGVANNMLGKDRQQFMQAQRNFINAVLRRESGAVISDQEFDNARQQYFPQPGDSAEVIQQKSQNRLTAIQGIMGAAGPSYRPPQNYMPKQQQQAPITAVNPQTGQRIQFKDGQWVPAQ